MSQSKHLFYTNCLAPGILTRTGCCLKVTSGISTLECEGLGVMVPIMVSGMYIM